MIRFTLIFLIFLIGGCSQEVNNQEADEKAIRELFSRTTTDFIYGKSASKYVEARAENALLVVSGMDLIVGKENILKFYERGLRYVDWGTLDDYAPNKFPIDEIIISGDLAFTRVTYSTIFTSKATGIPDTISSRHFYIWQKQNGQWKITHDTATNVPYNFANLELEFNRLGYRLLNIGKIDEAIKTFKQNVEFFPKSSNVYDSLGEAYMKKGETELAIQNYKKSLELNPNNTNAIKKIEEMSVK